MYVSAYFMYSVTIIFILFQSYVETHAVQFTKLCTLHVTLEPVGFDMVLLSSLAQRHSGMRIGGVGDQTIDLLDNTKSSLTPEAQPPIVFLQLLHTEQPFYWV